MYLISGRLTLREVCWKDLNNIYKLQSYPEVDEFNTLGIPESIEDTKDQIRPAIQDQKNRKRRLYIWIIQDKIRKDFIGITGIILILKS
jgi:hypothetical protein